MLVFLSVVDEEYRHNLPSMHYAVSYIQNYFILMQGQRKCQSNIYIQYLVHCLRTQNKILSDQKQPEQWRVTTDRTALISNTNTIQKKFKQWLDDEATCQFCKKAINQNRYYSIFIEMIKSQLARNSTKIEVKSLIHLMKDLKMIVDQIKSGSKCLELIIVIN